MPLPAIDIDRRALDEAVRAVRWYAQRSQQAAAQFVTSVEAALERIATHPDSWPTYLHETRVYGLPRFPYPVVYLYDADRIRIVAIAHAHRRPGYWRRRLK